MTDEEKLNEALFLISELLTFNLFQRSLMVHKTPLKKDLFEHEIDALKFISKNKPKEMCLWLANYMRDQGYLKF